MEISREEIIAYTEAATKTATALEKIADRLIDISTQQRECHDKFCASMLELVKSNHALLIKIDQKTEDITWLKWLWGAIGAVVAVAWIVMKMLGHA